MTETSCDEYARLNTVANNINLMVVVAEILRTTSQEQEQENEDMSAADMDWYGRQVAGMKKNWEAHVVER